MKLYKGEAGLGEASGSSHSRVAYKSDCSATKSLDDATCLTSAVAKKVESSSSSGRLQGSGKRQAAHKVNSERNEIKNEAEVHK